MFFVVGRIVLIFSVFENDGKVVIKSFCICVFNIFRVFFCFWIEDKIEFGCFFFNDYFGSSWYCNFV